MLDDQDWGRQGGGLAVPYAAEVVRVSGRDAAMLD